MQVSMRANFATLLKELLEKSRTVRIWCGDQTFSVTRRAVLTSDCLMFADEDTTWIVPFSAIQRVSSDE